MFRRFALSGSRARHAWAPATGSGGVPALTFASSAAPSTASSTRYSDRQIARRLREKQGLRSQVQVASENDMIVFPRERVGLDYDMNWALVGDYGVAPRGDAHRNAPQRRLLSLAARSPSTFGVTKGIGRTVSNTSVQTVGVDMSEAEFTGLFKAVRRAHLSDTDTLFVHDSEPLLAGGPRVRTVADSASAGLYCQLMMRPPVALGSALDFQPNVVAFVAEQAADAVPAAAGPTVIVHPSKALVLALGTNVQYGVVRDQLAGLVARQLAETTPGAAVCTADAVAHEGRSALIFRTPASAGTPGFRRAVRSRHHTVWTEDGALHPLWTGASYSGADIDACQLVEKSGSGKTSATATSVTVAVECATGATAGFPQRIVFAADGKAASGKKKGAAGAGKQIKLKDALSLVDKQGSELAVGEGAADALKALLSAADKSGSQFWTVSASSSDAFEREMVSILLAK